MFDDSGNVYRVERIKLEGGQIQERRIFLFQITEHGNIMLDGVRVDRSNRSQSRKDLERSGMAW